MKKIAIFVSGAGESAERIVKLFNEGNRVKTVLVVANDSGADIIERLKALNDEDLTLIYIPDGEWQEKSTEVANLIKDKDVRLIVLDDFTGVLTDEIMEATEGEILRVSSPEQAPREVVAALEADLRKPVEETIEEKQEDLDPTPESEWADALKIQFTPPKVPTTPPEVPDEIDPEREELVIGKDQQPTEEYNRPGNYRYEDRREFRQEREEKREPMPSTWLIWSILVTIFCCFIPGIIAIIFSSQVTSKYYMGDIEGAKRASYNAEIWIIVSFVLGVLTATLYLPFLLIS